MAIKAYRVVYSWAAVDVSAVHVADEMSNVRTAYRRAMPP